MDYDDMVEEERWLRYEREHEFCEHCGEVMDKWCGEWWPRCDCEERLEEERQEEDEEEDEEDGAKGQ